MSVSQLLQQKANIVRALSLISTSEAGSGHPTSCFSAADLTTVLFDKYFSYDLSNPRNITNDRFIISKGHVAPLYYSLFSLAGGLKRKELLTLRKFNSRLEGHPTPRFSYADVSTGSLGQGLSIGAGISYIAKREKLPVKTFVLLGDGELAEGQNYEATNFASLYKLDNLIAIADINGLGQTGKTAFYHDTLHYEKVFEALGFNTKVIDGHNFEEIDQAFSEAVENKSQKPFIIIAKTIKGKGVTFIEDREDFHGKPVVKEDVEKALTELGLTKDEALKEEVVFSLKKPKAYSLLSGKKTNFSYSQTTNYEFGQEYATREVFGEVLAEIGKENLDIYAIDGDVGNSTFTEKFKKAFPERFVQSYIAEQNMVSVAGGASVLGKVPVVATFGAFLTRAYDQIRMASISKANIKFVGSHSGVSIGEDGPSQMALEDIAMFSPVPESVILHPADAVSTAKLIPQFLELRGISYLRTLRPKTRTIYKTSDEFRIGGLVVIKNSQKAVATVVACGVCVFEALDAYEKLLKEKIEINVIDAYSLKPLDSESILKCVLATGSKTVITVEDHYIHGGLGDIVASEVSGKNIQVIKLGIKSTPFSGDKNSLMKEFEIDSDAIVKKVKGLL